jgi:hypothetical protein
MMTRDKGDKFSNKHGPDAQADPIIKESVIANAIQGELPCAVAFKIAAKLGAAPFEIGKTVDLLNLKLSKCQLGLFGYKPDKKKVKAKAPENRQMKEAIQKSLTDGKLACSDAWEIANRFKVTKMSVSGACEFLDIKIKPCQLGAF